MPDISKERRANIRKFAEHRKAQAARDGEQFPSAPVDPDELLALLDAADERDRLLEALTPGTGTKIAYIGEFSFVLPEIDEDGDEHARQVNVPWTTIKEIMAAIRDYAKEAPPHAPL